MITLILFILGFIFLIKGADLLVEGASSIAKKAQISTLVIGLTIVSFGTSAPELLINLVAGFQGSSDIAIGNILGSNIANILLILGISAIIYPLKVSKNTVWKEIPLSVLAVIIVGLLVNDALIDGSGFSVLSRIDGLILLSFFVIFIYYTFGIAKVSGDNGIEVKEMSRSKAVFYIILGLVGLAFGGHWIVKGAVEFAGYMNVSESLIALTIIAIGTSLPEIATSVVAAMKKQTDIAIGNVVGSNIFNLFWILGLSATLNPIEFNPLNNFDVIMTLIVSMILFSVLFIGKKHTLMKYEGVLFLILYFSYIGFLVLQEITF